MKKCRLFNRLSVFLLIVVFLTNMIGFVVFADTDIKSATPGEIWWVTDLHYISPTLIDDRDAFISLMSQADGKVTHYISELYSAFEEQALQFKPEAILFTGDLTLNGAPQSHTELAEKLSVLQDAGISVLVIPGNHDISTYAYRFTKEGAVYSEGTDACMFKDIYADLGYNNSLSRDTDTFSYVYELSNDTRLVMLDVNSGVKGSVPESTLIWLQQQLIQAQKDGCTVISATHQNVLTHNPYFAFGYVLNNAQKVLELYEKYNVKLNLSGHMHIQHSAQNDFITEVLQSSAAVYPHQFGILHLTENANISYHTGLIDVSAWAEQNDITDENLLHFSSYSSSFFDISNSGSFDLHVVDYPPEQQELVLQAVKTLNREYFAGYVHSPDPTVLEAITAVPGTLASYVLSMQTYFDVDNTALTITYN